ncbi:uncharacterized protein LOC128875998 [Hylaeus volcanicus]|uniref:uncharacterized protein LOC128875998 n=1 Tax=Hylaeus volcanicus TaxID=313075 RepID=UPI0023B8785C|nr:uncharacterized protein LOC128875998 [Hylaeus volcanicus]
MKRCKRSFYYLFVFFFVTTHSRAQVLTLNVNFEKPVSVIDEKFLSLTVDPSVLLRETASSTKFEESIRLAKALSPAYVRFGGTRGTFFQSKGSSSREDPEGNQNFVLSESDWVLAHRWADNAGLDTIACISAEYITNDRDRREDVSRIVSFSDRMGLNASWQLGYECQTRCNVSATDLARGVANLRRTLNTYPRYSNSRVIGPDVVTYKTNNQRRYLWDYLNVAISTLSAITWHPEFDSVTLDNERVLIPEDNLEKDIQDLSKVIGPFMEKRPLWIAESKPEKYKSSYLGALVLARRLGNAAKSKVNVFMRQPSDLTRPTPDYWVSLLHKTLIGGKVFETEIENGNTSHVYLYCHCTKATNRYEKGSVIIFGANPSPENVEIDLKGTKITTIHKYVLLPGFDASNRMFAETVLLNNEPLTLTNDTVPDVKPAIVRDSNSLRINFPSTGIGFWVLPDFKVKSCTETGKVSITRIDKRVPRELGKTVRDIKVRVKRKERNESQSRSARKPNARRELEQLKDFVRKKLDEYEGRITSIVKGLPGLPGSAIEREHTNIIDDGDDTSAKLAEFKDRLTRIEHLVGTTGTRTRTTPTIKGFIGEAVAETVSLISKIQNARSSSSAIDYLESLYHLLTRASFTASSDHSGHGTDRLIRTTKRSKRDLFEEVAAADSAFNSNKEILRRLEDVVQVRSNANGRETKSGERGRERETVRPSVVELEKSDSGENTFYGFFETIPLQGFPRADLFVTTDNSPRNDRVDYDKDDADADATNDREAAPTGTVDNLSAEHGNDYRLQLDETDKYFVNSKTSYDRTGSANFELCQAETYQPRDTRATRKHRNLYAILDEEMINEDDANSKDCDCRVVRQSEPCVCRPKRNPPESLESERNAETSSEQETYTDVDVDVAGMNSHDVTDVEVFSELADSPMEILKLHTESPDTKIQRDANEFPRNQSNSEIVDNYSLGDSSSTMSTFNENDDSISPSNTTKIHLDQNTFYPNRFGESAQEKASSDTLGDVAEYTRTSWENSPAIDVDAIIDVGQNVADQNETLRPRPWPEQVDISESENSSTAFIPAILSDESIVATEPENDYNNDTTVQEISMRPVEIQVLSGTLGNTENKHENPKTLTTKNRKQDGRRIGNSSSKRNKSSDARPWETRLMDRARALLTRRKMLDEKKEKRPSVGVVSTLNSNLRSTGRLRQRAKNRADRLEESNEKVREKRYDMLQESLRNFVNVEEIEMKAEEKKRNPSKREANDDVGDTIDRIPIYHPIEAKAYKENDASSETVKTSSIPITEVARMRSVRERIFNSKDPQKFRHSGIIQLSDPREPTDAIIRSRDLYENETATKKKFSNDENKYDRSYLALVENFDSPRIFHYQRNPLSDRKRSPRVPPSPNPDARYYDTKHTYVYDSFRRNPYENLEIVQDSSEEIDKESNELPVTREIYVIDPSEMDVSAGEPALKLLYRDPLKTRKIVYETIWKPVLYNPYKIRQTNQLEGKNRLPGLRDPRGKVDYFQDLVKLQDSARNLNTGELLRILIDALDLRYADELFERLTGSKENQSRDETTRLERDNELEQIPESKENSVERKSSETSDTQRTLAKLSMVYRDTPNFLQDKSKSEESEEGCDHANENTSQMLQVYTANERENESSEAIQENVNIESEMPTTLALPWTKRLGRFRRQTFERTKDQPLELQRLEQVPSSPKILTHSDIDDVEKSMVRKIAHLERSDNENRGLSSFVEESIPKLQNVVVDGLEKAKNLTGTVERLIENLDKNFNEASEANVPTNSTDLESIGVARNTFHSAIINVKKFFTLLTGITHILHR